MEYQVIWSPNAIKCLHNIGLDIIRLDCVMNANKLVNKIKIRAGRLTTFPQMGRRVPEFKDDVLYEVYVAKKRIIYEIIKRDVNLVAIVDGRMELHTLDADLIW